MMEPQVPSRFFVLFHSPGPNWLLGTAFREQPNVRDHVQYMAGFLESQKLVMGGPFLDDSGGMMILACDEREEAEHIAEADPTVISGLLKVEVKEWLVPMRTV